jgi:hypothetical protein
MKQIKEWKIGWSEYEWTLLLCMNNIRYSKGNKSAWASVIACEFHKTFLIVLCIYLFLFFNCNKNNFSSFLYIFYMKDKSLWCVIYTGMWVDALSIIAIRNERMRRQFHLKINVLKIIYSRLTSLMNAWL